MKKVIIYMFYHSNHQCLNQAEQIEKMRVFKEPN